MPLVPIVEKCLFTQFRLTSICASVNRLTADKELFNLLLNSFRKTKHVAMIKNRCPKTLSRYLKQKEEIVMSHPLGQVIQCVCQCQSNNMGLFSIRGHQ